LVDSVPKSRREYAEELIIQAKKGLFAGLPVYGDFDKDTDTRNMIVEQIEEVVDGWNYNEFDRQMHPERLKFQEKMKSLYLAMYIALREEEEQRTTEGG
jgi:hypothetical protein